MGSFAISTINIPVGDHIVRHIGPLAFDVDTILSTVVAGVIVVVLGFVMRAKLTSGVPNGLQLFFETAVDFIEDLVESSIGKKTSRLVPLAFSLFLFILVANWLSLIPTGYPRSLLPAPAEDVNTTYALAFIVIVIVHIGGLRVKRFKYFNHYKNPLNIIEELVKPVTLALRLFGNIFTGGLIVLLIGALLPIELVPFVTAGWKIFDMFIGFIQAFIFALLTVVYYGLAVEESH